MFNEKLVTVYGKPGCKMCQNAKEHAKSMGYVITSVDITDWLVGKNIPSNWRELKYTDVLASYSLFETLPLVELEGTNLLTYPQAMKEMKRRKKEEEVLVLEEVA